MSSTWPPKNPIICQQCGKKRATAKCQPCQICRMLKNRHQERYHWTPEHDLLLKRIYQESKRHHQLVAGITDVVRRTGFPRVIVNQRAQKLGITADRRHPWSKNDNEFLRENVGEMSVRELSKKLNRTWASVSNQIRSLKLSGRWTEGYSMVELQELFGVNYHSVAKWVERKWLVGKEWRFTDAQVRKFIKSHPEQYRLNRVDEAWFKGMLFPKFGTGVDVYARPSLISLREHSLAKEWHGEDATL